MPFTPAFTQQCTQHLAFEPNSRNARCCVPGRDLDGFVWVPHNTPTFCEANRWLATGLGTRCCSRSGGRRDGTRRCSSPSPRAVGWCSHSHRCRGACRIGCAPPPGTRDQVSFSTTHTAASSYVLCLVGRVLGSDAGDTEPAGLLRSREKSSFRAACCCCDSATLGVASWPALGVVAPSACVSTWSWALRAVSGLPTLSSTTLFTPPSLRSLRRVEKPMDESVGEGGGADITGLVGGTDGGARGVGCLQHMATRTR